VSNILHWLFHHHLHHNLFVSLEPISGLLRPFGRIYVRLMAFFNSRHDSRLYKGTCPQNSIFFFVCDTNSNVLPGLLLKMRRLKILIISYLYLM
jgi:hypothetical protein